MTKKAKAMVTYFLVLIVLAAFLGGCNNPYPNETKSKTKKVQLTTDNWEEYFSIDLSEDRHGFYYREIKYAGAYLGRKQWGFVRLDVTVTMKKGISLEDVIFDIALDDKNGVWGNKTISITMPSSGATTTKSTNSNQISESNATYYGPFYVPEVTGISGYVIVNND